MRKKVIAGNWKMNMLPNETISMITELEPLVKNAKCDVILCVPYTDLFYALLTAQGTNIKIGAQNMHFEEKGAFTGEVSGKMLKAIGVEYVIIGHSERRQYFSEDDTIVNKKIKSALKNDLKPIICVGENEEQRDMGIYLDVISAQVENALKDLSEQEVNNVIIAYEPIWAIGTGRTATKEQANEVIANIRKKILNIYGNEVAENIIIQYGGSMKPENAKELLEMSDIDGGLVGGASLNAKDFSDIIMCLQK